MSKIKLILDHAVSMDNILKYKDKVKTINEEMNKFNTPGFEKLGWKDLPETYNKEEFKLMKTKALEWQKDNVEILVVIGIGGSYMGAKAAIEFLQGEYPTNRAMEILFAGTNLSSTDLYQKLRYVEKKKFAICVISKSGTTLEPAIAFREFSALLEKKVGPHNAKDYISVVTDANTGTLAELTKIKGYTKFVLPENVGGRFSVLTPVGIFPMLCVGIDAEAVLKGAAKENELYKSSDLENNIAYQYAVARYLLHTKYPAELLVAYEPFLKHLTLWWKQLFAESEGKLEKGLYPTVALNSQDLHSVGQFIQEGSKMLFETIMWVEKPQFDLKIEDSIENIDGLNYLIDTSVHNINRAAYEGTLAAHVNVGKVPNIQLIIEDNSPESLGALFMFFERAVAMSGYLLKVNPFDNPGVEVYKANMINKLKANSKSK
ncbi:glucose-6-phosphate isomerase [Mycoplasma testudineum]|uniref:Glucose-6-phosphate isomerase n=1 Tax=Mycoplasma testudineum TaxID=244584 RepID=A0A4R6IC03_9MOLU|nr:glucose-6-phosphate isomerase [Mycoplasma testudineum]OYD26626.1 glucose-6-phosphate isomerase [Mycoplasma testudineum]TDO19462.1 glucose-6-phosphate isomerase [Mycoplasma testudineum]